MRRLVAGIADHAILQAPVAIAEIEDRGRETVCIGSCGVDFGMNPGPERSEVLAPSLRPVRCAPRQQTPQVGIIQVKVLRSAHFSNAHRWSRSAAWLEAPQQAHRA